MFNACIVGYGAIGPVHANAILNSPNVKLYAVCDIDKSRAELCAKEYDCKIFTDYNDALDDENIDVVHICIPHYLHKDFAIKALRKNKNVVLEKPVALNNAEFEEVAETVATSDKKFCVMLQNRTNNCVRKMKEILENDDDAGKLLGIIGSLNWKRDEAYYNSGEWRGKIATEGGGLLINQAVHLVDLMLYFGGELESIHHDIKRWHISNIEVEDTASALMQFKNNIRGIFNATNCYITDEPYYIELKFENRHLRYADGCLYDIKQDGIEIIEKDARIKIGKNYWGNGHQTVIDNFYSTLAGETRLFPTLEDSRAAMNTVYDFYSERSKL